LSVYEFAKFGVLKAPFPAGDILDPNIRV